MGELELIDRDIAAYLARHERKQILRFLTAGSVDDGKSTLIGRLLHDSNMVFEDQLDALKRDSAKKSSAGGEIDYSLLVDGLLSEREQGITIDVAYRYFATERRKFIIADTPGHEQYTRNMATGASTADLAIILVDARQGVLAQTKRHSYIASLLGIRHLCVAVNKMDLVGYSEGVFASIRDAYLAFAERLGRRDVRFIPLSALKGDNVVVRSDAMPWYAGPPLLEYLETVPLDEAEAAGDLRYPVQLVLRPDLDFRGFAGTVAAGVVRRGDDVMALPSRRRSRVKEIVTRDGSLAEAFPPLAVTLTLEDEIDVGRGDMLVHPDRAPQVGRAIDAMVVWMHERPMRVGGHYLVKHTTQLVNAEVTAIAHRVDVNTLETRPAEELGLNEIGRVTLVASRPLLFDPYVASRATGSIILVDRLTNATVGAGMIRGAAAEPARGRAEGGADAAKGSLIAPAERVRRLAQRPATVWLTGLPKSGKSAIAYALERRLFDEGYAAHVVDPAGLRGGVSRGLGFTAEDRAENARRAAEVARHTNEIGLITIAGLVSPYAAHREEARAIVGPDRFLEIYVSAPLEACEARDEEGLFARARAGELPGVPGVSAPYEAPASPALVLPTHTIDVEAAVERLVSLLRERGIIR